MTKRDPTEFAFCRILRASGIEPGSVESILLANLEERFKRDRQALLPLPPTPYDACDKRTTRVTSLSLVRYRANDYSVPTRYGHRQVLLKGYVDEIVICCRRPEPWRCNDRGLDHCCR